jgi:hypothetical protein
MNLADLENSSLVLHRSTSISSTLSPLSDASQDLLYDDMDTLSLGDTSSPTCIRQYHATLPIIKYVEQGVCDVLIDLREYQIEIQKISQFVVSIAKILKTTNYGVFRRPKIILWPTSNSEIHDEFIANGCNMHHNSDMVTACKDFSTLAGAHKVVVSSSWDVAIEVNGYGLSCAWINLGTSLKLTRYKEEAVEVINFYDFPGTGVDRLPKVQLYNLEEVNRVTVYIDWQNINVPLALIDHLISGIRSQIRTEFTALNDKKSSIVIKAYMSAPEPQNDDRTRLVVDALTRNRVECHPVYNKKPNAADREIEGDVDGVFADGHPDHGLVIVSGDRDFSPTMSKLARCGTPVLLFHNVQSFFYFVHNKHLVKAIWIAKLPGLKELEEKKVFKDLSSKSGSEPGVCTFYNYSDKECRYGPTCTYKHICFCGSNAHRVSDHSKMPLWSDPSPCPEWNRGVCHKDSSTCAKGHVCARCLKPGHVLHACKKIWKCLGCPDHPPFKSRLEFEIHLRDYTHRPKMRRTKK